MTPKIEAAYGERVHDPKKRSVDELKKEQRTLQAQIKTQEARHGGKTLTRLLEEAVAAKNKYEEQILDIATVQEMGNKEQVRHLLPSARGHLLWHALSFLPPVATSFGMPSPSHHPWCHVAGRL